MHTPPGRTHFRTFGLEPAFELSVERLDAAYRALAAEVHPDRFAAGTAPERAASLLRTAELNEAYRTLRSPLLRARYLLALRGVAADGPRPPDPALLLEQLEWRERLEEARAARDPLALARLQDEVRARAAASQEALRELLDAHRDDAAAACVVELMFVDRLEPAIADALDGLEE